MKIFLEKVINKVDDRALEELIYSSVSENLSKLSEVCWYPKLKVIYHEFLHVFNVKEGDIDDLGERYWKGLPEANWLLQNDNSVLFYIFVMYYLEVKKKSKLLEVFMIFYMIRNYTNLAYRYIKYCNPETFLATLENLSHQHLFIQKKNIPSAIQYLAEESLKRYSNTFKDPDKNKKEVSKFIQETRHRLNQSMRSFANKYYEMSASGTKIKQPYDDDNSSSQHTEIKVSNVITTDIANRICVHREIDHNILNLSIMYSKNSKVLSQEMVKVLSTNKYYDYVHNTLDVFIKVISDISLLCTENKFLNLLDDLMSTKRKDEYGNFKKHIGDLTYLLMKDLKLESNFNSFSNVKQRIIYKFVATYLVLFLKVKLCGNKLSKYKR